MPSIWPLASYNHCGVWDWTFSGFELSLYHIFTWISSSQSECTHQEQLPSVVPSPRRTGFFPLSIISINGHFSVSTMATAQDKILGPTFGFFLFLTCHIPLTKNPCQPYFRICPEHTTSHHVHYHSPRSSHHPSVKMLVLSPHINPKSTPRSLRSYRISLCACNLIFILCLLLSLSLVVLNTQNTFPAQVGRTARIKGCWGRMLQSGP